LPSDERDMASKSFARQVDRSDWWELGGQTRFIM
jgi:hypothetical protein